MPTENKYVNGVKSRLSIIRVRTWTLTLAIIVAMVFYFLITVTTSSDIDWVSFVILCAVQIVCQSLYFQEGDLYGQKDATFVTNKEAYNAKAEAINENRNIAKLREYCHIEYEERKHRYILAECSTIGITEEELEILKQKPEAEIRKLTSFEVTEIIDGEEKSKLIMFSRFKRKKLHKLIFGKLPVEENHPETIMSAVEINSNKAIKDESVAYKRQSYMRKAMRAIVTGGVFAYIGFTLKDGLGITQVVSIIMFLTTMFTTAVIAFSKGEKCAKIYKSRFYLELSNFIDGFNEWNSLPHTIISTED